MIGGKFLSSSGGSFLMKVKIYFKSPAEIELGVICDIDKREYRRLVKEFENFLRDGRPVCGKYTYSNKDRGAKIRREVVLRYDKIFAIE
jgi:hypothetical protein